MNWLKKKKSVCSLPSLHQMAAPLREWPSSLSVEEALQPPLSISTSRDVSLLASSLLCSPLLSVHCGTSRLSSSSHRSQPSGRPSSPWTTPAKRRRPCSWWLKPTRRSKRPDPSSEGCSGKGCFCLPRCHFALCVCVREEGGFLHAGPRTACRLFSASRIIKILLW